MIGKTFLVQGFNEPRTVKIVAKYLLVGKFPAYKCRVMGDYKYFKDGDTENFLSADIIKDGQLMDKVKVISA